MTHTRQELAQQQAKLELDYIHRLQATNADLLAALRELRAAFAHVATSTASLALLDRTSAAIAHAEAE